MLEWNKIENIIANCKTPISYYFNILLNWEKIHMINLNLVSQFFLKYHYKTFIKYPIFKLNIIFKLTNNNNVINKFYVIYIKKVKLIKTMMQLKNKIPKFQKYCIYDFLNFFSNKILIFKSLFDKTKSNIGFFTKLLLYFNKEQNIEFINNHIEERLIKAVKLFSIDFYRFFEIEIMTIEEFYELKGIDKFKFIDNFYNKTIKILIFLDQKSKNNDILDYQLDVLMKPRFIDISFGNNLNSETENDDLYCFTNC